MLLLLLALQDQTVDAVRDYLRTGDKTHLRTLTDVAAVERAVPIAMAKKPSPDAGKNVTHEATSESAKIVYHLAVPEKQETPRPLLVTLHGQGGRGDEWLKFRLDELKDRDYYVLAPQAGKAGWGHSRIGMSHVLAPLKDALARYPIDPDRVWLDGFSMGANGTWHVGTLYPDLFAALAPRGGCPHFVKVRTTGEETTTRVVYGRNLKNLPVAWTVGAKDKGLPMDSVRAIRSIFSEWKYDVVYKEIPEGSHEWFGEETPRLVEWLKTKKRVADPREVRWSTFERIFHRAYWVEILEFIPKDTITAPVKDFDGNVIETRGVMSSEARLTATARDNRIEVTCDQVKRLRLWLNARLVDFSKPVVVRVNKKEVFKGVVKPSVETLLDEVRRRGDPSFLYPAHVTVDVP